MLLVATIFLLPLLDQTRLPLFIAALSLVISAVGVMGSWLVVHEMQRDRDAFYKPEVYANVELEGAWLLFVVRNTSRSPARNVTIKLDPCPIDRWGKRIDEVAFLHSPIKTLNPGSRLCKFLDTHVGFFQKSDVPRAFTVELHYESLSGAKYSEPPYVLDVGQYEGVVLPIPTAEESLSKIGSIMEEQSKKKPNAQD